MEQIVKTGGARIGRMRMSWPFAKLDVTKNRLKLNSMAGYLIFRPTDIISIEPFGFVLKQGIKINHRVDNYKRNIVFMSGSGAELINGIKDTGFLDNNDVLPADIESEISELQSSGAFPLKVPVAIAIVVIWNVLILSGLLNFCYLNLLLGAQLALGFIITITVLLLVSNQVRQLIMKKGRSIDGIRLFLYYILLITSIMLVAFTVFSKIPGSQV